jgi:Zn-dependent peptidase ImmA (M78 family)
MPMVENDGESNRALRKDLRACASPETLLAAILKHTPDLHAPVDVEAMARRVGITDLRDLDTAGMACALLADIGKTQGVILSAKGTPQRRRFAIAHQLGHFLLTAQRGDRQCAPRDLLETRRDTPRRKEEMQANRFAAGLLMPKPLFAPFVAALGKPGVAHLPVIAAAYDVTLEAAASRYADLSQDICALLLAKDGVLRLARPSRSFPPLALRPGDAIPAAVRSTGAQEPAPWQATEARDWLALARDVRPPKLQVQTLGKANGFALIMLFANAAAERRADEEDAKEANARPKFGR